MEVISSMLMQDHSPRVKDDEHYLKEERKNSEIVFCEERLCDAKNTTKEITIEGDTYFYANDLFECFETNDFGGITTCLAWRSLTWSDSNIEEESSLGEDNDKTPIAQVSFV